MTTAAVDDITCVIASYVTGMARGDDALLRAAFHPLANSVGRFSGDLQWQSLDAFIADCEKTAIASDTPVPPHEIESVTVLGDTAFARVRNTWAGSRCHDSLSLMQCDGRWLIVSKLFLHLH